MRHPKFGEFQIASGATIKQLVPSFGNVLQDWSNYHKNDCEDDPVVTWPCCRILFHVVGFAFRTTAQTLRTHRRSDVVWEMERRLKTRPIEESEKIEERWKETRKRFFPSSMGLYKEHKNIVSLQLNQITLAAKRIVTLQQM